MKMKIIATITIAVVAVCALAAVLVLRFVPINVTDRPYQLSFGSNKNVDCKFTGKWAILSSEPISGVYKFESNGISVVIDESDSSIEKRTYTRILDNKLIMETTTSRSEKETVRTAVMYNPDGLGKIDRTIKTNAQGSNVSESYVVTLANGNAEEMKFGENNELTGSDEALETYSKIQVGINDLLKDVPGLS